MYLSPPGTGRASFLVATLRDLVDPVGYRVEFQNILLEAAVREAEEAYAKAGVQPESQEGLNVWPEERAISSDRFSETWQLKAGKGYFMLTCIQQMGAERQLTRVEHFWGTTRTEVLVNVPLREDGNFDYYRDGKGGVGPGAWERFEEAFSAEGVAERFRTVVTRNLAEKKRPVKT